MVLPAYMYADPAIALDAKRRADQKAEKRRIRKARRIRFLVKKVMEKR